MTRQAVIELIIRKILLEHRTQIKAAADIGISSANLSRVLNDDTVTIPAKMLSWVGVEKIDTYRQVK